MSNKKRRATGHVDCNGKPIYEGDIVKVGLLRGPVVWDGRMEVFFYGLHTWDSMNERTRNEIEVVGQRQDPEDYVCYLG